MSREHELSSVNSKIVVEVIAAMFIGILGASLNNPQLKEITWRSEMKKRFVRFASFMKSSTDARYPPGKWMRWTHDPALPATHIEETRYLVYQNDISLHNPKLQNVYDECTEERTHRRYC